MSTPPQDPSGDAPAPRYDDRTRDIRLPSLPDRPGAVVRPEWQAHVPQSAADTPSAAEQQPGPGSAAAPPETATVSPEPPSEPAPPRPYVLPNEPTDELSSPPGERQQTLAFDSPAGGAPAPGAPWVPGNPAPGQAPPQFGAAPFGSPSFGPPGHDTPSDGPPGYGAPAKGRSGRGGVPERQRRWPWVVLAVLPILVIVGAGLLLLFLLRGV